MRGKLVIFSAPSGAGKTTIVRHLLNKGLRLEFSISACNRARRKNEVDGKDYYFLSTEEFREKIKNSEFIEWEEVYEGRYYGTLKSEIERIWANGNHVIFDIDVKGGLTLKNIYKEQALSVFIMAPSIELLKERLNKRFTETKEALEDRIRKAKYENSFANKFDKIILNDDLDEALEESFQEVKTFLSKK